MIKTKNSISDFLGLETYSIDNNILHIVISRSLYSSHRKYQKILENVLIYANADQNTNNFEFNILDPDEIGQDIANRNYNSYQNYLEKYPISIICNDKLQLDDVKDLAILPLEFSEKYSRCSPIEDNEGSDEFERFDQDIKSLLRTGIICCFFSLGVIEGLKLLISKNI